MPCGHRWANGALGSEAQAVPSLGRNELQARTTGRPPHLPAARRGWLRPSRPFHDVSFSAGHSLPGPLILLGVQL